MAKELAERQIPGTDRAGRGWWRVPEDFRLLAGYADADIVTIPETEKPLRPYQRRAVEFALSRRRALIADGMRLGKTLEALATAYASREAPWVAIVPAAKKWDWADEARASIPGQGERVEILEGRTPRDVEPRWLYVLNYEITEGWAKALTELPLGVAGVILDESVYVKGRKSKRFVATAKLCDSARWGVIGLSGEPVENRPSDLWGQLRCIRGEAEFGTFSQFHRRHCGGVINEWGGYDYSGATNEDELRERLYAFTIRRTKYDPEVSASMPQTMRQLVSVEGGPNAAARAAVDVAVTAVRSGERTVIFSYHREAAAVAMSEVAVALKTLHLESGVTTAVLTGAATASDRSAEVRRLQATPGPAVLSATIDSIGMGLELSTFDVVAFTELHYVPTRLLQAEERLYAVGRVRPIGIYYCVVRGSDDERVATLVVEKLGQIERVLGADAAASGLTRALAPAAGGVGSGVRELTDLVKRLRALEGR